MRSEFFTMRFELLLFIGLFIMLMFMLLIITFSWVQQRKRAREETEKFRENHEYNRELSENMIHLEEKERFEFAREISLIAEKMEDHLFRISKVRNLIEDEGLSEDFHKHMEELTQAQKKLITVSKKITPTILIDNGLVGALKDFIMKCKANYRSDILFDFKQYRKQDDLVETTLFRIAEEVLLNALNQCDPNRVDIELRSDNKEVILIISDNGAPFDLKRTLDDKSRTLEAKCLIKIESRLRNNAALSYEHLNGTNRNKIIWQFNEKAPA